MKIGPKSREWLIRRVSYISGIKSYTLENNFSGRDCGPIAQYRTEAPGPWGWLVDSLRVHHHARVRVEAQTLVHVTYHSNHWLEITLRDGGPEAPAQKERRHEKWNVCY